MFKGFLYKNLRVSVIQARLSLETKRNDQQKQTRSNPKSGIKITTGCLKTTKIAAMQAEAHTMPLDMYMKKEAIKYYYKLHAQKRRPQHKRNNI